MKKILVTAPIFKEKDRITKYLNENIATQK